MRGGGGAEAGGGGGGGGGGVILRGIITERTPHPTSVIFFILKYRKPVFYLIYSRG